MTPSELRETASRRLAKSYSYQERLGELPLVDLVKLADFAAAVLARLSDAEVGEILGREVRGE